MLLWLSFVSTSSAQDRKAANPAAVPPNLLVLVHQEIEPGKASERQKLVASVSRACDRLDAPSFWIDLQPLTGARETLTFDLFDSFEHMQEAHSGWTQFYAAHPDLAQTQGQIDSLVSSQRTVVAVRRDDLSALVEDIDLSEARFVRVMEVRLFPGHESDFAESMKLRSEARTNTKAEAPWVVYQVKQGASSPTFLVFLPLSELKEMDDLLLQKEEVLEEREGEGIADRLKQIARESYASFESNLYVVHPETSHVPKEFADGDPDFWRPRTAPEPKVEPKPDASSSKNKKKTSAKPLS
jgi:hypothetical protein